MNKYTIKVEVLFDMQNKADRELFDWIVDTPFQDLNEHIKELLKERMENKPVQLPDGAVLYNGVVFLSSKDTEKQWKCRRCDKTIEQPGNFCEPCLEDLVNK